MFDGATLLAVEAAGVMLLMLALMFAIGMAALALYASGKVLQAVLRFAVRQLRAKAFESAGELEPN